MSGYITTRALARQAIAELTAEADRDPQAVLDLLRARAELPHGFAAVVRVLGCHGTFAVLPDRQNPLEHARAAHRHLMRTMNVVDVQADPVWPIDNGAGGTGELHVACVGGRALITCELVGRGGR